MIFVDSNVVIYAVGRPHPLRDEARDFFRQTAESRVPLATSAEVLQELLHVYLPVGRPDTLDAAFTLVRGRIETVWPVEYDDVLLARSLSEEHASLEARDLLHLSSCVRRDVTRIRTFDRALAAAMES